LRAKRSNRMRPVVPEKSHKWLCVFPWGNKQHFPVLKMIYGGFVYILTTKEHTALYVGVTANLGVRIHEHKKRINKSCFTARYCIDKLVYYRVFGRIEDAIQEEKRLKAGSRSQKIKLINEMNPAWGDLSVTRLRQSR
jgi:putative endonuclease